MASIFNAISFVLVWRNKQHLLLRTQLIGKEVVEHIHWEHRHIFSTWRLYIALFSDFVRVFQWCEKGKQFISSENDYLMSVDELHLSIPWWFQSRILMKRNRLSHWSDDVVGCRKKKTRAIIMAFFVFTRWMTQKVFL